MEALINSSDWMDYGIALLFGVVAITLILLFTKNGPKKFLSILAVIATVGISVFFTRKKHKWAKAKLDKHNEEVKDFLSTIKEREATIEENNKHITELSTQRQALMDSSEQDQKQLSELNEKIDKRINDAQAMKDEIARQKEVIDTASKKIKAESPLPSIDDILASSTIKGGQS